MNTPTSSVTVLGECVADASPTPPGPAPPISPCASCAVGGPANTAVALARLGTPTRLSRISNDVGEVARSKSQDG